ncbi:MAG TPA: formate dehydrogenase accessory sulfurtransferase FdhD [Burkholderiales bacterium]|nr:formate dehydrogenase accessory sulfurtransferase FdhD [Burkholderiales bacterium]
MFGHPKAFSTRETVVGCRWDGERSVTSNDTIAIETAVALVYNGVPHVVMMATPEDIEDFVLGFSLSEGIIHKPDELSGVRIRMLKDGIEANIDIAGVRFRELDRKRRNLIGRIGCGLCGAQTLAQAVRHPPPVATSGSISPVVLQEAMSGLSETQSLHGMTGAVHAAAWIDRAGRIQLTREDVGRHNALDKLIGAMIGKKMLFGDGAALITSRASYEMVQKSAVVGIEILCAISAPTALAVRMAQETGVTLVAFARGTRHTVYAHSERIAIARKSVAV